MIFKIILFFSFFILASCSDSMRVAEKIKMNPTYDHFYLENVQPVLDAKCVACHSCYNAPCQLDLTSFEGVYRGASHTNIYDFPALNSNDPSRLGIDARSVKEWRKKSFYSVTELIDKKSIMSQVLMPVDPKIFKDHVFLPNEYRTCHDDPTRSDFYLHNARGHMPYGFPDISETERKKVNLWLSFETTEFSEKTEREVRQSKHADALKVLSGWENYFNENSLKSKLRSRYIFEHLFLGLLSFDSLPGEHYRIVRAENESGEPLEIATVRPFDDPKKPFFYRFKKSIRTVMDKANMTYVLNDKRLERWKELFDQKDLLAGSDTFPAYGDKGSNAFRTFKQLDPTSRYKFLLDDAYYHVMTFIKGPVCRGPTALNVINDHFWVFFMDPDRDPTLKDKVFMETLEREMFPPTSSEDKITTFNKFRKNYWKSLEQKYAVYEKTNLEFSEALIWDGGPDANKSALLTIYRHFDSAQVMKGSLGVTPKTAWVLDYQVFEDIYYNLVSGYNVFGPVIHQLNTRLYMEISRISAEDLFLNFLSPEGRMKERHRWSQSTPKEKESLGLKLSKKVMGSAEDKMHFEYPYLGQKMRSITGEENKDKLVTKIIKERFSGREFNLREEIVDKNFSLKLQRPGKFVKYLPEVSFVRFKGLGSEFFTLIRNNYHYNVSMLFFEKDREDDSRGYLSLVEGVGASYPNVYMVVEKYQLNDWSRELLLINSDADYQKFLRKYGISRQRQDFWEHHQWFDQTAFKILGREAGRFDLSRFDQ